jgi:outer membrane protein TolC
MQRTLELLLAIIFLLCISFIARGQTLRTIPANPDSALQHILAALDGAQLSLRDAINSALANAASVRTAEAAFRAARGSWRKEAGAFDPSLFFTFNHIAQQLPTSSPFAGAERRASHDASDRDEHRSVGERSAAANEFGLRLSQS